MTVSPVIPGASAQTTARTRPSEDSDDQSKSFYSYLRSSSQDDKEGTSDGSVSERTARTDKSEKQTGKKADADQAANAAASPVPPLTEQPAPPLSITALLGLPTAQKSDTAETGKVTEIDGKAVLSSTATSSDQRLTTGNGATSLAQFDALKSNSPALTNARPKLNKAQSADAATALPFLDVSPPNEGAMVGPVSSASATTGSATNKNDVELLTAGATPNESAPATTPGNLAFAMRLSENPLDPNLQQRAASQAPSAEPMPGAAQVGNADLATAVQAAVSPQLKEQSQQHNGNAGTAFYEAPQAYPQKASDTPQPGSDQTAHTSAADLSANHEVANSEPIRNVHMQVVGDDNSRVDVRLMDRGGELHVSVKSGDTNLAQSLQDHMPELTSRLEQQRFQTEVWIPKPADNGKAEMSSARDFSSGGNNNSSNSNHSDQQGKKQQQSQPDWVDVLENSTRPTGKNIQTWLQ